MAKKLVYETITFEDMKAYIEDNAPNDKEWFKSVAIDSKGVYSHFKARKAFCEKYMPEIIPVAKEKAPTKADILANW